VCIKWEFYFFTFCCIRELVLLSSSTAAVSLHVGGYCTFEWFIAVMRSKRRHTWIRSDRWELLAQVRSTVVWAGCGHTCSGRRAGKHVKARRHCNTYSETSDGKSQSCQQPVGVIVTRRLAVSANVIAEMLFCDARRPTLLWPTKPSVENSCSPVLQSTLDLRHQRCSHLQTACRSTNVNRL